MAAIRGFYPLLVLTWLLVACSFCMSTANDDPRIGKDRRLAFRRDATRTISSSSITTTLDNDAASTIQVASSSVPSSSLPTALPRPFDSILGENFTQPSCPNFFSTSFINNATFQSCVPFSLLLQNSKAFFRAGMYENTLTPLLNASCSVTFDVCKSLMASLASRITNPSVCGNDYALGNPLVVQAYRGLLSYAPMHDAACLRADPSGKSDGQAYPYCYVTAINSTSQADSQMYFLPLGADLPTGSSVSCSSCTKKTMAIFADAASSADSPLNKDYIPAANIINTACGGNFVNASASVLTASPSKKNIGCSLRPNWRFQLALGTFGFLLSFL